MTPIDAIKLRRAQSALADLIGHAKWVGQEFNIHYKYLDEIQRIHREFAELINTMKCHDPH